MFLATILFLILTGFLPIITLGIIISAAFLVLVIIKPQILIYALVFYIPFEEFFLKQLPSGLASMVRFGIEPLFIGLFLIGIMLKILRKQKIFWGKISIFIFLFIIFGLISNLLNSGNMSVYVLGIRPFIRYFFLYLIIINLEDIDIKKIFKIFILTFILQLLIGMAEFLVPSLLDFFASRDVSVGGSIIRDGYQTNYTETYIFGTLGRYNIYANYIVHMLLLIFPFYMLGDLKKGKKVLISFILILGLVVLGISNSRTSLFSLFFAGFIMSTFMKGGLLKPFLTKTKRKIIIKKVTILRLFAVLISIPILLIIILKMGILDDFQMLDRLNQIFSYEYINQSLKTDRLYVLFYLLPFLLSTKPLFGYGPGEIGSDISGGVIGSNNLFNIKSIVDNPFISDVGHVSLIAQTGLVGYVLFVSIFIYAYRQVKNYYAVSTNKYHRILLVGILGNLVAIFIENFGSFNVTYRAISGYMWIMFGLLIFIKIKGRKNKNV